MTVKWIGCPGNAAFPAFSKVSQTFPDMRKPFLKFEKSFLKLWKPFFKVGRCSGVLGNPFKTLKNGFVILENHFPRIGNRSAMSGNHFLTYRIGFDSAKIRCREWKNPEPSKIWKRLFKNKTKIPSPHRIGRGGHATRGRMR